MGQLNHKHLAALLLLIGTGRHYGWLMAGQGYSGVASKGLGAVAALCLLCIIVWQYRSRLVLAVAALYAFEELQTALCSFLYLVQPWPIAPGQSMCSARAGFDIGAATICIVGVLAYHLAESLYRDREP